MKKRMINTIRTDALEQKIAWHEFNGNAASAVTLRTLAHDIGAQIDNDEIERIIKQYREIHAENN